VALEPAQLAVDLGEDVVGQAVGVAGPVPAEVRRDLAGEAAVEVLEGDRAPGPGVVDECGDREVATGAVRWRGRSAPSVAGLHVSPSPRISQAVGGRSSSLPPPAGHLSEPPPAPPGAGGGPVIVTRRGRRG